MIARSGAMITKLNMFNRGCAKGSHFLAPPENLRHSPRPTLRPLSSSFEEMKGVQLIFRGRANAAENPEGSGAGLGGGCWGDARTFPGDGLTATGCPRASRSPSSHRG